MMQPSSRFPWMEILLGILGLLGLLFLWGLMALFLLTGLMQIGTPMARSASIPILTLAVMFGINGLFLLPGLWFLYQKATDHPEPQRGARLPFSFWQIPFILAIWVGALLAGQWASGASDSARAWMPLLIPFAVIPPIWLTLNLAARGYDFRPRWRGWAVMTVGSTMGPFLIMMAEIFVILAAFVAVIVFVVVQPELSRQMQQLSAQMESVTTTEEMLSLLAPLLTHPGFVGGLLFGVSIVVPLIEEMLKPLAVWLFSKQLTTARDGFVLGAVSGAAYALFETGSLGAGAGSNWLFILGARGGTSLLHIVTSAMMGAAIVGLVHERKYLRLVGIYFASIFLHGLWNAFSILDGLGAAARIVDPYSILAALGSLSPYGLGAVAFILLLIVLLFPRRHREAIVVLADVSQDDTIAGGTSL